MALHFAVANAHVFPSRRFYKILLCFAFPITVSLATQNLQAATGGLGDIEEPAPTAKNLESPKPKRPGLTVRIANSIKVFNNRCSLEFDSRVPARLQKPIRVAGTLIPVIPFFRSLADADKFFFLMVESPLISMVTSPSSVALAKWMKTKVSNFTEEEVERFWSHLPREAGETYFSYIITSTIRNGITLSPDLTEREKYWLAWFFNTTVYSIFTAGPTLAASFAEGENAAQVRYACDMITFSMLWPLLSQAISQRIILPVLFSRFPAKSVLDKIYDEKINTESILTDLDQQLKVAESESKVDKARSLKASRWWVKILRKDLGEGKAVGKKRKTAYWATKTMVSAGTAVVMVGLYMALRWSFVGTDASDTGWIDQYFRTAFENGVGWLISPETWNEVLPYLRDAAANVAANLPEILRSDKLLNAVGQGTCASPFSEITGPEAINTVVRSIK